LEAETQRVAQKFEAEVRQRGYVAGDVEGFQGCLYFYPTFFTQLGLEVINPHDRQSNAGKQPIYFECVPAGASGDFTLLYVPCDQADVVEARAQAAADVQVVMAGVAALMTVYGFGAKTSNGYGTAAETFVTDGQGKAQALVELRSGGRYRCRTFGSLAQAAEKLAEALTAQAGGVA